MFHALSAALEGALAPDIPPVVDFRHQWNLFLRFYTERKPLSHKSQPVEKTYLTFHLNNMLKLLLQEQRQLAQDGQEQDGLGACMEFLIHHQVLDILSSICQADTPPGIRPYIFNYFIFLLTRIRQTILPYVNIYLPMRRLLMLSTIVKASPTENQELTFITSLVTKVKGCPELLPLFAHQARPGDVSHLSSRRSSNSSSMLDLTKFEERLELQQAKKMLEDFESSHLIVSALVNLVDSADYLVAVKAMDALLVVCGLPDEEAAENAIRGTPLTQIVGKRLQTLFSSIPTDVEAAMVEEIRVNWVEAHHLLHSGLQQEGGEQGLPEFHGKQELVSFFSWLDFLDSLVNASAPTIATALCDTFREEFLETSLQPELMEAASKVDQQEQQLGENPSSHSTVRLLALLAQCWTHLKSDGLAGEFAAWLFGDSEAIAQPELNGVVTHPLKHALLTLCLSKDQEVTLEALSMLDVILERPCQPILQSLALASISTRGYFNSGLAEAAIQSWSDEEDEREKMRPGSGMELTPNTPTEDANNTPGDGENTPTTTTTLSSARRRPSPSPTSRRPSPSPSPVLSRTMAPTNIARVINAWLYLVPDELRSADSARDSGYEQYVKNAQSQVSESFKTCEGFGWPREATGAERSETSSSDSRPEADPTRLFYEGEFLHTLFDMLESLLERDYDVNLQVTSLLSRLCQLPHPHLHEYLLNPTLPLSPGARSMHSVLRGVLAKAKEETSSIQQLNRKVYVCRKTLLGSQADRAALNLTLKETKVIDGLIVLEEFSKEVAAIALVKYHLTS